MSTGDESELRNAVRPWAEDHRIRHEEGFSKLLALIRSGYGALAELEVHPDSLREVVVKTTWARCLEHAEAVVVLLQQGLLAPAQVSLRALCEAVFTIRAVARHDDVLAAFLAEDDYARKELYRKAKQSDDPRFSVHATPELEAELTAAATASGARRLTTGELAERAGLRDWYLIVYALFTGPAHTKIRDLQRYLREKPSGTVEFSLEHRPDDVQGLLSTAGIALVYAYDALDDAFAKGLGATRQPTLDYYLALGNEAGSDDVVFGRDA